MTLTLKPQSHLHSKIKHTKKQFIRNVCFVFLFCVFHAVLRAFVLANSFHGFLKLDIVCSISSLNISSICILIAPLQQPRMSWKLHKRCRLESDTPQVAVRTPRTWLDLESQRLFWTCPKRTQNSSISGSSGAPKVKNWS